MEAATGNELNKISACAVLCLLYLHSSEEYQIMRDLEGMYYRIRISSMQWRSNIKYGVFSSTSGIVNTCASTALYMARRHDRRSGGEEKKAWAAGGGVSSENKTLIYTRENISEGTTALLSI